MTFEHSSFPINIVGNPSPQALNSPRFGIKAG
jgi:hypothetical protein